MIQYIVIRDLNARLSCRFRGALVRSSAAAFGKSPFLSLIIFQSAVDVKPLMGTDL